MLPKERRGKKQKIKIRRKKGSSVSVSIFIEDTLKFQERKTKVEIPSGRKRRRKSGPDRKAPPLWFRITKN